MLKLPSLAVGLAALSIVGATSANAQSATSCPGGSDKNASDCLQIFDSTHTQLSLIAITEQDELDSPGKQWGISGLVDTNPLFTGQWIQVTEPGGLFSDIVGIPTEGTIAFISDPVDRLPDFTIIRTVAETPGPIDVSDLLGPVAAGLGDSVSFQSDLDSTVPEPTTWAMMLLGFAGLAYAGWRRSAKARPFARLA